MPSETCFLVLQLSGPMQSWGFDSRYSMRNTGLFPTKSGVSGICCAALGYPRGSDREITFLDQIRQCLFTAVAVPKKGQTETKAWKIPLRRIEDFQTVMGTKSADGKYKKDAVLTQRQYLCDAEFIVFIEGPRPFIEEIGDALKNPVWGIWLGRKSCIPSKPVFAGIFETLKEIEEHCLSGNSLDMYAQVKEVVEFHEGKDFIPDIPVSFDIHQRNYLSRRVTYHKGE